MPQFTVEEAGIEEMSGEDEDVDIGCTTPVMNDDFWKSQHPNSPLFTPLQQIPQSPVNTEVQMGSEEPHATPSVHEEIPATSAEENVNEELKTQAVTEEEAGIPQPVDPEIAIPEVVMQLTDTPQPKPKDPFSKKQKFKADDFFCEHVFFTDYNPYDSAHLRRKRFWTASQVLLFFTALQQGQSLRPCAYSSRGHGITALLHPSPQCAS